MNTLFHVLVVLARNRFLLLPVFLILAFMAGSMKRWGLLSWSVLLGALGIGNILIGPYLSALLLYHVGQTASAQVISTYATAISDNDHDVVGYNVMIRMPDAGIVSTRFEDDEDNVYPVPDGFSYPQPDEPFNVHVLPGFPRDFVILTDDDSPWSRRQRCNHLSLRVTDAQHRFDFARGAPAFRAPYADAIDAYLDQGCVEAPGVASFRADRQRALAGQVDPGPAADR